MQQTKRNRWFIFLAAWIITFFIASAAIFSVFSQPIAKLYGWSLTDVNLAFSIYQLFLGVIGIFGGRYADKRDAAPLMYAGGLLFGLGWFLTGSSNSIPMLYLTFGVMAGTGGGLIYNATISTALKWFPDMKGKISGFLLAAAAFGPFALAPFTNALLTSMGTDSGGITATFRVLGTLFFVCIASVGWLMRRAPQAPAPAPAGAGGEQAAAGTAALSRDYRWNEMLKAPFFWVLFFTFMCAGTAGTMMISSTSIIAQTQIGLSATAGALAVSVSTISNFTGRLTFGILIDKIGDFKALLLSLLVSCTALLLLGTARTPALFFTCVVMLGFAFGAPLVIFPPITSRKFGTKNLGINYGIMFLGFTLANYVGPRIAASFKDMTGSFVGAYFTASGIAALGAVMVVLIILFETKRQRELSASKT